MKKHLAGGVRRLCVTLIPLAFFVFSGCGAKPIQDKTEDAPPEYTPPKDTREKVIPEDLPESYFTETIEGEDGDNRYITSCFLGNDTVINQVEQSWILIPDNARRP